MNLKPFHGAPTVWRAVQEGRERKLIMDDVKRKNRDCGASPHVPTWTGERVRIDQPQKKWGSRLGPGTPRRRVPLSVSFSHRRVGSSILASLSGAGGNDLQKMGASPFPLTHRLLHFVL